MPLISPKNLKTPQFNHKIPYKPLKLLKYPHLSLKSLLIYSPSLIYPLTPIPLLWTFL